MSSPRSSVGGGWSCTKQLDSDDQYDTDFSGVPKVLSKYCCIFTAEGATGGRCMLTSISVYPMQCAGIP